MTDSKKGDQNSGQAFTIDPEFQALIPPLSDGEIGLLTNILQRHGCRDPLVTWNGLLLDGHHRFEICSKNNIPFRTVEQPCADRNEAKIWIVMNQLGRRNLPRYVRIELAKGLKPLFEAQAKANQQLSEGRGQKGLTTLSNLKAEPINTRAELAKLAGVSEGTVAKVEFIDANGSEELKQQLRKGKGSVSREYKKLRYEKEEAEKRQRKAKRKSKPVADPSKPLPPWARTDVPMPNPGVEHVATLANNCIKNIIGTFQILATYMASLTRDESWKKWFIDEPKIWERFCDEALGISEPALQELLEALEQEVLKRRLLPDSTPSSNSIN